MWGKYLDIILSKNKTVLFHIAALNLAYSKPAWQVLPAAPGDVATVATDCSFNAPDSFVGTQTAAGDGPFWAVDLGVAYEINEILFTPRDTSEYMEIILNKHF